MCFKEVSPVFSSPPYSHRSLPPHLSLSFFLRLAADPRDLGALRRARRSDSQGPRWPPTRGTALTRQTAPASSSPSKGPSESAPGVPHCFIISSQREKGDYADDAPAMVDFPFVRLWIDARRSPEQPQYPKW